MTATTTDRPTITAESFTLDRARRGRDGRSMSAHATIETLPDGRERRINLTVSHNKDAKAFYATLTRLTYTPAGHGSHFPTESYRPLQDMARVGQWPVARYSAKALENAYTNALHNATVALADQAAWLLDPADC